MWIYKVGSRNSALGTARGIVFRDPAGSRALRLASRQLQAPGEGRFDSSGVGIVIDPGGQPLWSRGTTTLAFVATLSS